MAAPLPTSKPSVDLNSVERVSRIRRDPPPKLKEIPLRDPDEVDRREVVFGVILLAIVLIVLLGAVTSYNGWSPSNYTVRIEEK